MFRRQATLQIGSFRAVCKQRVSSLSSTVFVSKRCYASENHNMNPKVVDLIYKMQTTPSVMDALRHFEELVDKKGLKEQAGFGRFISMMKDKEVEEALRNGMHKSSIYTFYESY